MPSVTLNDIQLAVFERVRDATNGILPIKHDDKTHPQGSSLPYAELIISPSETQSETIDGGDLLSGFLLFNVYVKKNSGTYYPAQEGQKFLDLFPRDLRLGQLWIKKTGTIKNSFDDGNGWDITPVAIEYEASSCQM